LALGYECCVIDCTSNRRGKIINRFVPVATFVLETRWFGKSSVKLGAGYGKRILRCLSKVTKRKIDYYKKFNPTRVALYGKAIRVEKERWPK
jgi:hypothetical protein